MLTAVSACDIVSKGITLREIHDCYKRMDSEVEQTLGYVSDTWMGKYPVEPWNIHEVMSLNIEIANRTNNPLESYNRTLALKFAHSHPSVLSFIEVCREESIRYVSWLEDIRSGTQTPPVHASEPTYPRISHLNEVHS